MLCNLLAFLDEGNNVLASYVYARDGALTGERDLFGTATHVYNNAGNEVHTTDIYGKTVSATYDIAGRRMTIRDADGNLSRFGYDALGRLTLIDDGNGRTVTLHYGFGPDWIALQSPTIGHLQRTFTDHGLSPAGSVGPDGAVRTLVRDAAGRVVEAIDPLGHVTRYHYNVAGGLARVTDPLGGVLEIDYDPASQVVKETNALGHATRYTYTPDGKLGTMTNALGHTWTQRFTPMVTTLIDPLSRETKFLRSPHGLPLEVIYADGSSVRTSYLGTSPLQEAEEFPTSVTDEAGRERVYTYNETGDLIQATDLAGTAYTYEYADDQLLSIKEPTGESRLFSYNERGLLESETFSGGAVRRFAYGTGSSPTIVTLPSGATISREYDAEGRPVSMRSSLEDETRFIWNARGELITIEDATGTTQYGYDALGNLTEIRFPNGSSVQYDRNILGQVATVTLQPSPASPVQITRYGYDTIGNVISVIDPLGGETVLVYDEVNRLIERRLPNAVKTTYEYDARDHITAVRHRRPDGTLIASRVYERGRTGEPTRIDHEDGASVQFAYDPALRLAVETYHDASGVAFEQIRYTYDLAGNRRIRSDALGDYTYAYASGHKLVQVQSPAGSEEYTYDADGRISGIVRDGIMRLLAFDAFDHLTAVDSLTGNTRVEYIYDGAGNRVRANDASGERRFLVAPVLGDGLASVHAVVNAAGALTAGYVYDRKHPLIRFGPDDPVYYLTDAMGSVIALVNDLAEVVAQFAYDGFGNLRAVSGPRGVPPADVGGDFRFHGAWLDAATGLYYLRARDYDPRTGRFLSRDPAEPVLHQPESLHPYVFANSNPQLFTDPTGAFTLVGINISLSIQDILQQTRALTIQALKEAAKEKIQDATGQLLLKFILPLADVKSFKDILKLSNEFHNGTQGNAFDDLASEAICGLVKGVNAEYIKRLRLDVPIDYRGKPTGNGFGCEQIADPDFIPRLSNKGPNPDFVITKAPPEKLEKNSDPNSDLIGDFKVNVKNIKPRDPQFIAILRHARDYGSNAALWISLKGSELQAQNRMKKARDYGVFGVVLILLD